MAVYMGTIAINSLLGLGRGASKSRGETHGKTGDGSNEHICYLASICHQGSSGGEEVERRGKKQSARDKSWHRFSQQEENTPRRRRKTPGAETQRATKSGDLSWTERVLWKRVRVG